MIRGEGEGEEAIKGFNRTSISSLLRAVEIGTISPKKKVEGEGKEKQRIVQRRRK